MSSEVVVITGGQTKRDGQKATSSGVVGCIASVVFDAERRLNWTVSSALGSAAVNVTECTL